MTLRTKQLITLSIIYIGAAVAVVSLVLYLWHQGANAHWGVMGVVLAFSIARTSWMLRKKKNAAEPGASELGHR